MKLKTLLMTVVLALFFQHIADAAVYRSVDKNGVVTFRDTPSAENPEKAELVSSASTPASTSTPVKASKSPAAKADNPPHQVELYVTSWCPYCKKAEDFFRAQGIPFTAYDIELDSSAARRKELLDGRGGVPFAIINGEKIYGFSENAYREALKKKP